MGDGGDFQEWVGMTAAEPGLAVFIDNYDPDGTLTDGEGVGKYYWHCFDVEDEELRELVQVMT